MAKKVLAALVIVVVLAAILTALIYFQRAASVQPSPQHTSTKYSLSHTIADVLSASDQDFATAEQYRAQMNYAEAEQYYQKALPVAQDPAQTAQIDYDIALMQMYQGNYSQSIAGLKQVAADQAAGPEIQAYAVESLGFMYYNYYFIDTPGANDIPAETFTGDPYSTFLQNNNLRLAYRRLFEYAVSFAPLGYSETGIGLWYANDLVTAQHGATTTTQGKTDIDAIEQSLAHSGQYVQTTQSDPALAPLDSAILGREAWINGILASVGVNSLGAANLQFQQALQFDASQRYPAGNFTAYRYAAFLASQYGTSRASDIASVLAPFTSASTSTIAVGIPQFFAAARTTQALADDKMSIIQLANIDPAFKTYLISLGWRLSDFSRS